MFTVTKRREYCIGHRIYGYDGKCKNLHGHSFVVELTVQGTDLNELGIGVDFKDVKAVLDDTIGKFDHRTLLYKKDPLLSAIRDVHPDSVVEFAQQPTAENISKWLYETITSLNKFLRISVKVWETSDSFAVYP